MKKIKTFIVCALLFMAVMLGNWDIEKHKKRSMALQGIKLLKNEYADLQEIKKKLDKIEPQIVELEKALQGIEQQRKTIIDSGKVHAKEDIYLEIKSGYESLSRRYLEKSEFYNDSIAKLQKRYESQIIKYNSMPKPFIFNRNKLPTQLSLDYIEGLKPNKAL